MSEQSTLESVLYHGLGSEASGESFDVPIVLIAFNRPGLTRRIFESIAAVRPKKLFLVADGPRPTHADEQTKCAEVRRIISNVDWSCVLHTNFSISNMGCAVRVSSGIDWVFKHVDRAIILEDDCLPSNEFFKFCREMLNLYEEDCRIGTIAGSNLASQVQRFAGHHLYSKFFACWGWATWRRAWSGYDREMLRLRLAIASKALRSALGSDTVTDYYTVSFLRTAAGEIDSWAYPMFFHCLMNGYLSVIPTSNLVSNIGFGEDSTNTKGFSESADLPIQAMTKELTKPEFVLSCAGFDAIVEYHHLRLPRDTDKFTANDRDSASDKTASRLLQTRQAVSDDDAARIWMAPFYASGTLIRVSRDEAATDVPVEHLRIGDQVVTSGDSPRVITWLSRHVIDCRQHPQALGPIRIAANALGAGRPGRDLYLSPSEPICVTIVEEFLVPVGALVNGATIAQVVMDKVTYWQVGLDVQDVLLAENVPCESGWLAGDRVFFPGSTTPMLGAHRLGDEPGQHCRPYHAVGMFADVARDRFIGRIKDAPGWYLDRPPMSDVHLLVDGTRVEAQVADLALSFAVPAGARDVWLVSPASQPSVVADGSGDARALGLCLLHLVIDDGIGDPRTISAADPRLTVGFHDAEEGVRRWTTSRAALPTALWNGVAGKFTLRLDLLVPLMPRWMAPPPGS